MKTAIIYSLPEPSPMGNNFILYEETNKNLKLFTDARAVSQFLINNDYTGIREHFKNGAMRIHSE